MMRSGRAALCLAFAAACAPSRPASRAEAPSKSPAASPSIRPAVVLVRAKPDYIVVNLRQLVTPPRGLIKFNIADAERLLAEPPRPTALMPADPDRPPPPRPRIGSEALSLADRAFERGDAFDAAAQYRALRAIADSLLLPVTP